LKISYLIVNLCALSLFGTANAQTVNIAFPATTPISTTATSPILCKTTVSGYEFDSTLLGANLSATTCTAANLFPATEPGYLAVGKYGQGINIGGFVNITPPAGVTFAIDGVTINDYGLGNNLTIYATDAAGTAITYPLTTVAGVSLYTIPPSSGLVNLINATIQSANNRFDFTNVQLTDSTVAPPTAYSDAWVGNGFGPKYLTNDGVNTANSGTIQLYPSPGYFTGTQTGGSIVYASPTETFTIANPVWTFNPVSPARKNATGAATLTATGTGVDANGTPVSVSVTENLKLYYRDGWHLGVLNGQVTVTY
jgi:hypothetical protein